MIVDPKKAEGKNISTSYTYISKAEGKNAIAVTIHTTMGAPTSLKGRRNPYSLKPPKLRSRKMNSAYIQGNMILSQFWNILWRLQENSLTDDTLVFY